MKIMKHRLPKLPAWLLIAGIAVAVAIHVALLLRLGVYGTGAGALGVAAFIVAVKHIALAKLPGRATRRTRSGKTG